MSLVELFERARSAIDGIREIIWSNFDAEMASGKIQRRLAERTKQSEANDVGRCTSDGQDYQGCVCFRCRGDRVQDGVETMELIRFDSTAIHPDILRYLPDIHNVVSRHIREAFERAGLMIENKLPIPWFVWHRHNSWPEYAELHLDDMYQITWTLDPQVSSEYVWVVRWQPKHLERRFKLLTQIVELYQSKDADAAIRRLVLEYLRDTGHIDNERDEESLVVHFF
jgi:hypothetical protein